MSADERRRWRRLKHELWLTLAIPDDSGERTVSAVGTHLNPGGIFVQMEDPPLPGTRVRVTLAAEATSGVLSAEGEVVDRVVAGDGRPGPPGCGLHLDDTGPAWAALYEWLADQVENH